MPPPSPPPRPRCSKSKCYERARGKEADRRFSSSATIPVARTTLTARFCLDGQYTVAVYPPKATAFQPDGVADVVLQQEPVVVGTAYAPGPRPRVYSPPGYDDVSSAGPSSEFNLFR